MSQMNVFRSLGHTYISDNYIRNGRAALHGDITWWNRMACKRMSQHDKILRSTITLQAMISNIPYLYYRQSTIASYLPTIIPKATISMDLTRPSKKNHQSLDLQWHNWK
jgi:hypothetical protein